MKTANLQKGGLSQLVSLVDGAMESRSANEGGRRTTDIMSDVVQEFDR